jgi:hypothetical protein
MDKPVILNTEQVRETLKTGTHWRRRKVYYSNSFAGDGSKKFWGELDFGRAWTDVGLGVGSYLKVWKPDNETYHRVYSRWQIKDRFWVQEKWKECSISGFSMQNGIEVEMDADYIEYAADHENRVGIYNAASTLAIEDSRILLEIMGIKLEYLEGWTWIYEMKAVKEKA